MSGIYRDKTMAVKLKYIPNNDAQKYPFCRLQLVVVTFKHLNKLFFFKFLTNKKTLL